MKLYLGTADEDLLLAGWWMRMRDDGDLSGTFMASGETLSGFFAALQGTEIAYHDDDEGMCAVMWVSHFMSAGFVGLWIRKDCRTRISVLRDVVRMYEAVLSELPTIIGVTKQKALLPEHERFGYTVVGRIPGIWDGEDAWIVSLTAAGLKEAFNGRFCTTKAEWTEGQEASV